MTYKLESLAARAAAAAAAFSGAAAKTVSGPHPTLDEVSDATFGIPDEDRAAEVLDHAEVCDECAEHVTALESVVELTEFAYPVSMPAIIEEQLVESLRSEATARTD